MKDALDDAEILAAVDRQAAVVRNEALSEINTPPKKDQPNRGEKQQGRPDGRDSPLSSRSVAGH